MKKFSLPSILIVCALSGVITAQAQSNYEPYPFKTFTGIAPVDDTDSESTGSAARFYTPQSVAADSAGKETDQLPTFQLPGDFFAPGVLFEDYVTGSAIAMTSAGIMNVTNGSTTDTGPGYTSANFYPYVMLDQARNYVLMHPGGADNDPTRGASIGYRASQSGFFHISGAFARQNNSQGAGDGVTVMVFTNFGDATPFFTANIGSDHAVNADDPFSGSGVAFFNFFVTLAANDVLRFAVFTGTPRINRDFDSTALQVTAAPVPPVITSPTSAAGTTGQLFVYQFEAIGATSVAVTNLPPGLTFNAGLSAITGIPTTGGIFQVGLSATNSNGTTNATLALTVQAAPAGLVIVSSTCATGRTGRAFSFQLQTIGGSSATRFAVENVLPPGFNLDPSTGFISGTPASDGSFGLAVSAIDGAATTHATLQLTFTSDPTVPIITSPATAILAPGQPFTYSITADANGTFGYIGSDGIVHQAPSPSCAGLPAGLCFDGNHTISGTFNPPFGSDRKSATRPNQTGGIITNVQLFAANPPNGAGILSLISFLEPSGAGNIATRLAVGTGENVLIGGFIIEGNAPKKVVIRAIGPSLTQFGVPNAIADPVLDLNAQAGPLSSNDDWRDNPGQASQIIETQLQPSDDREAAILAYLNPGPYTAVVRGKNNSTGNALVEVYDLGTALLADTSNSRLANIATRGTVLGGDSVMIGGFIIRRADTRVVVRAIGPSLTAFGISGALQDPTLELRNANAVILIGNDDWQDNPTQAAEIQQRMLAPSNPRESALVTTLQPGQYTAIVSGKGGATGVAVVEGYALGP